MPVVLCHQTRRLSDIKKSPARNSKQSKHKFKEKKLILAPQAGARITPYYKDEPVLLFKDHPYAQQTHKQWQEVSTDEQAKLKARLHAPLEKKRP